MTRQYDTAMHNLKNRSYSFYFISFKTFKVTSLNSVKLIDKLLSFTLQIIIQEKDSDATIPKNFLQLVYPSFVFEIVWQ